MHHTSCSKGKIIKKKIAIFSSVGIGIVAVSYVTFIPTDKTAIAAVVPTILALAACPGMYAVMGGVIVFMNLFSKY